MIERARMLSLLGLLVGGVFGLISSTQTWIDAEVNVGPVTTLHVAGGAIIPGMTALSLAAIAGAITVGIVGTIIRYLIGVVATLIGGALLLANGSFLTGASASDVGPAVTDATGIEGASAIADIVTSLAQTPWVTLTLLAWVLVLLGGLLTLATAHTWTRTGKRFRTEPSSPPREGPLDKIDSWDDLSRGDDPTQSA